MLGSHPDDEESPSEIVQARARAKLRKERADARRAEALAGEIEGHLVRVDEIRSKLGRYCAGFRRIATQAPSFLESQGIPPEYLDKCRSAVARAMTLVLQAAAKEFENLNDQPPPQQAEG